MLKQVFMRQPPGRPAQLMRKLGDSTRPTARLSRAYSEATSTTFVLESRASEIRYVNCGTQEAASGSEREEE